MQGNKLYEYSVIRFVPKPEREEFFNIGLILFSKKENYIRVAFHLCPKKFDLLCQDADKELITSQLENFEKIAQGEPSAGPIALLEVPERFRWLTAVRSAVIQTSRPHPGKTKNLDETFERLFAELVK